MTTLHEHLREMLLAIDLQMKIPNTKLFGGVWLDDNGPVCVMCAAGAWYAQRYGRCDLGYVDELSGPIGKTMVVMNFLRRFDVGQAYDRLYGGHLALGVPAYKGNILTMDAGWRASQEKLLLWLTKHNL